MESSKLKWCMVVVTIAALTVAMSAQAGQGTISGIVTDSSGAAIQGAAAQATNIATGVTLSSQTTAGGLYTFIGLQPGQYQVKISKNGFQTFIQKTVPVSVDQTTTVNVTLQPGTMTQEVTVTAAPPAISTANSTIGQLISSATIDRVPLVQRDVYQLVQLSSGITPVDGVVNNLAFNSRPGAEVSGYTINGALQGSVYYLFDGSNISIGENNIGAVIPAYTPPEDAIQEYRVETNNVPATYQSAGAGVISLVTKSGTNNWHGDLFGYARPNALAANDSFVKAQEAPVNKPPNFHRYQWGGSIGGPIKKDKLFIFGDYEGTQQRSLDTATLTVPTLAERAGDFSGLGVPIYDPASDTCAGSTCTGRSPFPGNIIPKNRLDPVAVKMAQFYPVPNTPPLAGSPYPINNYFDAGLAPNDAQKFDTRVDDNLSASQHLFGRFSFGDLKFGNANHYHNMFDPNQYQNITHDANVLLADDYIFGPNTVGQFRYSFTRHFEDQTGDPRQIGFNQTTLGFPAYLQQQSVYPDIPRIYFEGPGEGTAGLGSNPWTTFHFASMDHDAVASLDAIRGLHDVKFGAEFEKFLMNDGQPIAPSGWYMFDDTATSSSTWAADGSDFASFMLGMGTPDAWENGYTKDIFAAESSPYYGLYIQDDYHTLPNLTLNLGLRWDIWGGRNERYNRLTYFNPDLAYTVNGVNLRGGEQFVGPGGSPFTTNWKDISPRVGFSWQPVPRAVVRGGFGMFYGPSPIMVANPSLDSDGFFASTLWSPVASLADGNTVVANPLSNPFPTGVAQPTGSSLGPRTQLGNVVTSVLHTQKDPGTYDYNFGVQYEFPHQAIATVAYVGSRGLHLPMSEDYNQLPLSTIENYQSNLGATVPNPYVNAITNPTSPLYGATTVPQWQLLQMFPQFTGGVINSGVSVQGLPIGNSWYNSLQAKVEKRLTSHFTTIGSYTWGKLLTTDFTSPLSFIGTNTGFHQDWKDLFLDKSLSTQDVSNWFSWQVSYDLPIGTGRLLDLPAGAANTLLGGWTVNSVLSLSTGIPIAVPGGTGDPWFGQRPDLTCDPGVGAPHTVNEWFSYKCFAQPASAFFPGTAPTTLPHVRTDGTSNLDGSIYKNFALGEQKSVQFQFAAYNLTNSVQLGYPRVFWSPVPANMSTGGFGAITNANNTPRQLQLALVFKF
jgi:hypothetical protein